MQENFICILHINIKLSYKPRPALNIYKSYELESTFIECLDSYSSSMFLPTKAYYHSKTLIDNIFSYLALSLTRT